MPLAKLREFLNANDVKYITISHSPAYTAQEIAAAAHIPGQQIAKTVMVKLDGATAMAVIPAPTHVDLKRLADAAGAKQAELATEEEFSELFPNCETGAMPPFGNLYDMTVVVDAELQKDEQIAFNAGSWSELVQMARADFERLVQPRQGSFTTPA
jgi:Ala-tRNA(Pro) deacylase